MSIQGRNDDLACLILLISTLNATTTLTIYQGADNYRRNITVRGFCGICKNSTTVICCFGFYLNSVIYTCKKCMPGYSGPYCTTRCPYPTYGSRCQEHCDCSNATCDVSIGCKILTTVVNFSFFTFLSICLT
uniref:Uncharacterized protein n=1 Tax=Magallana gigas TaxID=29159 RepID=A0A8W8JLW0_MAGGI